MIQKLQRGFTLIELLVVIAIIGILAAVVLASLNDARSSGQDASIKQSIGNARSQAEIVYNANGFDYETVCEDPAVTTLLNAAANNHTANTGGVVVTDATASNATQVTCHDTAVGYAIVAPLNATTSAWCVDSSGFAGERAVGVLAANEVTCN